MTSSHEPSYGFDQLSGRPHPVPTEHSRPPFASLGEDELLTTAEVSLLLRTPSATLRTWRYQEIGPRWFHLGPRGVRYKRSDVLAWIARQYGAVHG